MNLSEMSAAQLVPDHHHKTAHRIDASRVWAVLIGINEYPSSHCSSLRGCVNDALKMKNFLVDELGMLEGHIQLLLSSSSNTSDLDIGPKKDPIAPTRRNIIDTLFNLSTTRDIHYGDNIIIYFAGHGSIYEYSDYYPAGDPSAEGSIKALCPMDRTPSGTDTSVPDISNREINTILTEISRTKGHHITVIVDCCYASGTTRDLSDAVPAVRRANPLPSTSPSTSIEDMLSAAHIRLRDLPKYHSVFDGDWNPDVTSHVLLAACTDYQPAEEEKGADNRWNGSFTRALIDALKSDSLKEESTYVDLFRALKERMPRITTQTPVVAGNVGERLWYRPETTKKSTSWGAMRAWLPSGGYVVVAGLITVTVWLVTRGRKRSSF